VPEATALLSRFLLAVLVEVDLEPFAIEPELFRDVEYDAITQRVFTWDVTTGRCMPGLVMT